MSATVSRFQILMQKIQERKIWVYEQTNEDNQKEAKKEFYRNTWLAHPNFSHDVGKIVKNCAYAQELREILDEIRVSDCTEAEKDILEKMCNFALRSSEQAVKVLTYDLGDVEKEELLNQLSESQRALLNQIGGWELNTR